MSIAKAIAGVGCIALGMAGLYFKVEYSGWVVFIGALVLLG